MVFLTPNFIQRGNEQGCIPLTRGYVALIDSEDYEQFKDFPWFALVAGSGKVYAAFKPSYSKKTHLLHRMLLGDPTGLFVDHRNGNTLDCRRENLRPCSRMQNVWNTRNRKRGRTGLIGVHTTSPRRFWGAIDANGISHRTKDYECPILAAAARDVLAQRLHGEFAVLNFRFQPV